MTDNYDQLSESDKITENMRLIEAQLKHIGCDDQNYDMAIDFLQARLEELRKLSGSSELAPESRERVNEIQVLTQFLIRQLSNARPKSNGVLSQVGIGSDSRYEAHRGSIGATKFYLIQLVEGFQNDTSVSDQDYIDPFKSIYES